MQKILIANRGEIALRIIRTCKRMGILAAVVHSEADQDLPFVKEADEAIEIGPGPVPQSYLKMDAVIQAAKDAGADAIHPGYGLLSENAEFARKVRAADLAFIGPDAETIEMMGDKITSRLTMKKAGVPVVPGTDEGIASLEEAKAEADRIGYPVMLKASAGGGGIGMVRCEGEQALSQHFETVKMRAKSYFGDDKVFIEKFIENGRHIEVQIFGDHHGNVVHLFERNCSVQRRNQKVIEESLSPDMTDELRTKLYEEAVKAGKAVSYKNAGTVEFIVSEDNDVYFLEMNTRLQVEHPVTEEITKTDLVEWQLRVADGEKLPVTQHEITATGHAIEYRLYAEDPVTFMPSPGPLNKICLPEMEGVRIDTGYAEGNKVTPFYDPMIAKVIVHADDRATAISKSKAFFKKAEIEGIKTNLPFFSEFLHDKEFESGTYHTGVIANYMNRKKEEQ